MKQFSEIVGNERIINHLKSAIERDRPSHAYVFHGEDGCGKRTTAETFAMGLLCEHSRNGEPCGQCRSCLQMKSGNHPDFFKVTHEKTVISVDDIREQLISEIQIKPYSSKYRIFIVDEAEKMRDAAQNALLKTLEEPPSYGIIILLSNNINMFLETILSRTVNFAFMPADREEVTKFLIKEAGVPDYQARAAAVCAEGNPGLALKWVKLEEFNEQREMSLRILRRIGKKDTAKLAEAASALAKDKGDLDFFLRMLRVWIRDVLYIKSSGNTGRCMLREEIKTLQMQAETVSDKKLGELLTAGEELRNRLKYNVNAEMSLEMFFMRF